MGTVAVPKWDFRFITGHHHTHTHSIPNTHTHTHVYGMGVDVDQGCRKYGCLFSERIRIPRESEKQHRYIFSITLSNQALFC